MNLTKIYKIYRACAYMFMVLCFGTSIYYYNEAQTLKKIIRTNTDIKSDKEIEKVVKDQQFYDKTGKLPEESKKPLDRLINKITENNHTERSTN